MNDKAKAFFGGNKSYVLTVIDMADKDLNTQNLINKLESEGAKITRVHHGEYQGHRMGKYTITNGSLRNTYAHGIANKEGWTASLGYS